MERVGQVLLAQVYDTRFRVALTICVHHLRGRFRQAARCIGSSARSGDDSRRFDMFNEGTWKVLVEEGISKWLVESTRVAPMRRLVGTGEPTLPNIRFNWEKFPELGSV